MAYQLPTFNILCDIWHDYDGGALPPVIPPDLTAQCQLRWTGRGPSETLVSVPTVESTWQPGWNLLFPAGTDVRDFYQFGNRRDVIECPAGTGRYYIVQYVDDVARGFSNEYRIAFIVKTGEWPVPIP